MNNTQANDLELPQIIQQLAVIGQYDAINGTIKGDLTDPIAVAWIHGGSTQVNGPLMRHIFATLGYAPEEQKTFVEACRLLSY